MPAGVPRAHRRRLLCVVGVRWAARRFEFAGWNGACLGYRDWVLSASDRRPRFACPVPGVEQGRAARPLMFASHTELGPGKRTVPTSLRRSHGHNPNRGMEPRSAVRSFGVTRLHGASLGSRLGPLRERAGRSSNACRKCGLDARPTAHRLLRRRRADSVGTCETCRHRG